MTRIIAGFAGSTPLAVPTAGTRPTSDRVREAIFSALDARGVIEGSRVLDLYAGSGALGLEAASRGASRVTLVDNSAAAIRACRANAARVLKAAAAGSLDIEISSSPVNSFLAGSRSSGENIWDIVFLDPPYELGATELARDLEELVTRIAPDAVVVIERSSRDAEPAWPTGLALDRRKDYGDTTVWWVGRSAG